MGAPKRRNRKEKRAEPVLVGLDEHDLDGGGEYDTLCHEPAEESLPKSGVSHHNSKNKGKESEMSNMVVDNLFGGVVDNIKSGLKIGAAGEATLLCVGLAEDILGRKLPLPGFLSDNPVMAELCKEFLAVVVVKAAANMVGGEKAETAMAMAQLAEVDIGVRAMHLYGPTVRQAVDSFCGMAQHCVGQGQKEPVVSDKASDKKS